MSKSSFLFLLALVLITSFSIAQPLPRSASFGASVSDLRDSSRTALKLSSLSGSLIQRVVEGSSADKAGFKVNDVLVSMDGEEIRNTTHFLALLKKHHEGDKVQIGYYRQAKLNQASITLQPKPVETSDSYEIIYSSVVSGANHLRTIITKPKGSGNYPAVLLIGGVGCYSIDNPSAAEVLSIKMWADSLAMNGFVTIRVEKPGMGDSKGTPCNEYDFNTEKQAYLDGLKQLKSFPYVDKEKVFIAGFSIGGVIAPLLAQEEAVKGILVYGTVGRNWLEYELENSHRQQLLENIPADSLDRYMRAEYIRLYGLLVEKKTAEQIIREHPETVANFFSYPMRIEYFQQVADINIRELWMKTKTKVLVMHGSSDFISSATEHKLIGNIVNTYHPGNVRYVEVANADHWNLNAENELASYTHKQTGVNPLSFRISLKWLKENL